MLSSFDIRTHTSHTTIRHTHYHRHYGHYPLVPVIATGQSTQENIKQTQANVVQQKAKPYQQMLQTELGYHDQHTEYDAVYVEYDISYISIAVWGEDVEAECCCYTTHQKANHTQRVDESSLTRLTQRHDGAMH